MAYNGRGFPLGRNRRWTMLKRSPVLPALAVLAILCGVLSEYVVHADDAKPDKKSEAPALGSDWHNLRDGLDVLFEQLQKENGIRASKICDDAARISTCWAARRFPRRLKPSPPASVIPRATDPQKSVKLWLTSC
jgi:hypothetical protein